MASDVLIPIDDNIQKRLDALKEPQKNYSEVILRLLTAKFPEITTKKSE